MRVKEKQRKKFHWWYIPLGIVLVLVLTAGGLVLWMHSMLPWPNMVRRAGLFHTARGAGAAGRNGSGNAGGYGFAPGGGAGPV